ncbi:unnamed protein product [Gordionus sp. m RMFG-2023]|uniref:glutamate receptor ionotropic, NMDA 2B-like isoform X2 n=1 Tax=Gordionus sp. m RMFG-2023 TaxID=3053472 RepID=UPI0030E4D446
MFSSYFRYIPFTLALLILPDDVKAARLDAVDSDVRVTKNVEDTYYDVNDNKVFTLAAILPNNEFFKRDYRRALTSILKEHNQQASTKSIAKVVALQNNDAKVVVSLSQEGKSNFKTVRDSSRGYVRSDHNDPFRDADNFDNFNNAIDTGHSIRGDIDQVGRYIIATKSHVRTRDLRGPEFYNVSSISRKDVGSYPWKNYGRYVKRYYDNKRDNQKNDDSGSASSHKNESFPSSLYRPEKSLTKYLSYKLMAKEFYVTSWELDDIIDLCCDKLLPTQLSAILFVNYDSAYSTSVASTVGYLFKSLDLLGIPSLIWNADNSASIFQETSQTNMIQLAPTIKHQTLAILSVLDRYSWERFVVISSKNIVGKQDIISGMRYYVLDPKSVFRKFKILKIVKLESFTQNDLVTSLYPLTLTTARIFVLHSSRDEASKIFKIANDLKLTGKDYMWIVTQSVVGNTQEFMDFDKQQIYPVGIFGVYFDNTPESLVEQIEIGTAVFANGVHDFVIKENLAKIDNFLLTKSNLSCHNPYSSDLIAHQEGSLLYDYFLNANFNFGSSSKKNVSFGEDGTSKNIQLDIINLNTERQWMKIGKWNLDEGLKIKDIVWPGNEHLPPKGIPEQFHLKVTTLEEPPFVIIMEIANRNENRERNDDKKSQAKDNDDAETQNENKTKGVQLNNYCNGGILCKPIMDETTLTIEKINNRTYSNVWTCCSGYFIDILEKLSQDLGFTYDLTYTTEEHSIVSEKGKSNILVDSLLEEKTEMAIGLTITSQNSEIIDFSIPFLETGIAIVVSLRTGSISPIAFLEPFDYVTWIMILLICIHAAAFSIFLYEYISPMGFDMKKRNPTREANFSVFRAIWLAWAILFGASVQVDIPKSHTSRYLITIWSMVAMVFIASYTANLAAFMISKEDHYDFVGIHDTRLRNPYSKEPPFKYGTVSFSSSALNIRNNYPDMYSYMKTHNRTHVKNGISAVKNGSLDAFIYDGRVLEYLVGRDDECKILTVGSWFAMTGYSIAFPKSSELKTAVDSMLMKYQENGDMGRLQHFWLSGDCKLKKNQNDSSHPLGLRNFISAFTLLGAGLFLSLIFLGFEHIYFKFLRKHLKKIDKHGICSLISLNMGRTLSFEKTVIEIRNKFVGQKCNNMACKTQIWKLKQELIFSGVKVKQLENMTEISKGYFENENKSANIRNYNGLKYVQVGKRMSVLAENETSL